MPTRRAQGTGSIFKRAHDDLWVGTRDIGPDEHGRRRTRRVTSKTFCGMLAKFSALPIPERPPVRTRRENMLRARAQGTHTAAEWIAQLKRQNGKCYYCGGCVQRPALIRRRWVLVSDPLVKDHKVPVVRGGSDRIDNIVGACDPCNRRKGTMTAAEYTEVLRAAAV